MTRYEMDELDKLFQIQTLENAHYVSILGGVATLAHHYKPLSGGLALRWYMPNIMYSFNILSVPSKCL